MLIVTGGLLSTGEKSIWNALKKQYKQIKAAKYHWLETKIKLVAAEMMLYMQSPGGLGMKLCEEKISLDGALFYNNILNYETNMREEFLEYQKSMISRHPYLKKMFNWMNNRTDKKLQKDVKQIFPETV